MEIILLIFIIYFGFNERINLTLHLKSLSLEPDAQDFYTHAIGSTANFYQYSSREPVPVFLTKLFILLCGQTPNVMRVQTILFSPLLIWFVFYLGKKTVNAFVGLCAAMFVAGNPYLIYSVSRGLRLELYTTLFLIFVWLLLYLKKYLFSGLVAGILCLTRLEAMSVTGLLLLYVVYKEKLLSTQPEKKKELRLLVAGGIICFIIVLPYIINCYRSTGDLFYPTNMHATFWQNHEFAGKPGYPTELEVKNNPYTPKSTVFKYIFQSHNVPQIIYRYLKGYYYAFFHHIRLSHRPHRWLFTTVPAEYYSEIPGLEKLVLPLGLIGILLGLFHPRLRSLFIVMLVFLYPQSFILSLKPVGHIGLDIRFAMHIYPFFAISAGYSIYWLCTIFASSSLPSVK